MLNVGYEKNDYRKDLKHQIFSKGSYIKGKTNDPKSYMVKRVFYCRGSSMSPFTDID